MTRINLIKPKALTDQHLLAEYKELTQVFGSLKRTLESPKGVVPGRIASKCPLNGGHVYFFYDKLGYLQKRYLELAKEMEARNWTPTKHITHWHRLEFYEVEVDGKIITKEYPQELFNDYRPTKSEKELIKERIIERIKKKPKWYRYKGSPLDENYFTLLRKSL